MKNKVETVRSIYLYLLSLVGVIMIIFGLISFVNQLLTVLIPSSIPQGDINYELYYSIQGMVRNISFIIVGIVLLVYHWKLILKEHRIGKRDLENESESSMNLFEAIFFYLLSFIGLMVFSFSLASFASNFFFIKETYAVPVKPDTNLTPIPPTIGPNVRYIVQSGIASIIGLVVWLLGFTHIHETYKNPDNQVDSDTVN